MSAVLEMRGVSKTYGDGPTRVDALRDVDLTVGSGELVAVMGPSGSGKSSMLTIAGTLEQPTAGTVTVGGEDVGRMSARDRRYSSRGYRKRSSASALGPKLSSSTCSSSV